MTDAPARENLTPPPAETPMNRIKRLRIRAWRRGIKEMDLVLGGYADAKLADLDPETLDLFEAVMEENDHDILQWVTRQVPVPPRYAVLMDDFRLYVAQER